MAIIDANKRESLFNLQEIREYGDLLYFLTLRSITTQYSQSVLGVGWAVLRPVLTMIVFTVIFGRLAKIGSDGAPYAIFSYAAVVPWAYFSSSLQGSVNSIIANANMIGKIYFPRIFLPLAPIFANLLDFAISLVVLGVLMIWFHSVPSLWILFLPLLVLIMIMATVGLGLWITALAIQYRDVKYAISFGIQFLMYLSPLVYPASLIPGKYRIFYGLNPMAGVMEGFRSAILQTVPMPWDLILPGTLMTVLLFLSGLLYFRFKERVFADVV